MKKNDIKNAPDKLNRIAKQIEEFLIKPLEAVIRSQGLDNTWKAPGPWK